MPPVCSTLVIFRQFVLHCHKNFSVTNIVDTDEECTIISLHTLFIILWYLEILTAKSIYFIDHP